MHLAQQWCAMHRHDLSPDAVETFRDALHVTVCRKYPWLTAELFALEGELGWGPGFREYDGEFYPPMLPDAPEQMTRFLKLLSMVQPRDILADSPASTGSSESMSRMLGLVSKARIRNRQQVISTLYGKIAYRHSPYTLGGARMYLAVWTRQGMYSLASAGLVWLLHSPINPIQVRAETVRRKHLYRPMAAPERLKPISFSHPLPPVEALPLLQRAM